MPNIIVIGGSAGGIEALRTIVRGLKPDLQAAVFVVIHVPASFPSALPQVLSAAGPLPASHAKDGIAFQPSRIYVAPPDRHLHLEDGRMRVVRGPRENRHRPAIDVLFRTAGRAYKKRVLGVLLSGLLDDGSAGLSVIKATGGMSIVQDPGDAAFSDMPRNAINGTKPNFILPASQIAQKILTLVTEPWKEATSTGVVMNSEGIPHTKKGTPMDDERIDGKPSVFSCPDCTGTLWELKQGELLHFRCRVGHSYSKETMRVAYDDSVEAAMWAAVRALEESAEFESRLADAADSESVAEGFEQVARSRLQHAARIREALLNGD
jgi:two-component system, chemotaxis family, protein-glutamate methylesterase/glutaminase